MNFENIFCHSYEHEKKKENFLKILNESIDICCPQNEVRLMYKGNKMLIIRNVTKEFQKNTLEYFYKRYNFKKNESKKSCIEWKENEIVYLKKNYQEGIKKLSKILNKSEYQISCMIGKLKLNIKKRWNKEDDSYLKENYLLKTDLEMAADLNRSLASIKSRRCRLGLFLKTIE